MEKAIPYLIGGVVGAALGATAMHFSMRSGSHRDEKAAAGTPTGQQPAGAQPPPPGAATAMSAQLGAAPATIVVEGMSEAELVPAIDAPSAPLDPTAPAEAAAPAGYVKGQFRRTPAMGPRLDSGFTPGPNPVSNPAPAPAGPLLGSDFGRGTNPIAIPAEISQKGAGYGMIMRVPAGFRVVRVLDRVVASDLSDPSLFPSGSACLVDIADDKRGMSTRVYVDCGILDAGAMMRPAGFAANPGLNPPDRRFI